MNNYLMWISIVNAVLCVLACRQVWRYQKSKEQWETLNKKSEPLVSNPMTSPAPPPKKQTEILGKPVTVLKTDPNKIKETGEAILKLKVAYGQSENTHDVSANGQIVQRGPMISANLIAKVCTNCRTQTTRPGTYCPLCGEFNLDWYKGTVDEVNKVNKENKVNKVKEAEAYKERTETIRQVVGGRRVVDG